MVLPVATALPEESSFPDLSFKVFSQFIQKELCFRQLHFHKCSLFCLHWTENPELLAYMQDRKILNIKEKLMHQFLAG